ncbi:hemicentin-1-like isoform X1 [Sesbania bispinosa]|nr:hemicentin-1-like isoform X1 [Sesbania bispinosa]
MSRDYVFSIEELSDPEVAVVTWRETNMLALAEKGPSARGAKRAAADAERAVATGAGSSALTSSKAVTQVPGERPLKKVRTEALKGPLILGRGVDSSASHYALQTPSDFLGKVGTWCLRGAMMAEFFHSTIDEVAALPQIKRDFEAVSKKLKDDEVVMQDALKKVKGLSDDNIRLTDKNKELEEKKSRS